MKISCPWRLLVAYAWPVAGIAQWQLVPDAGPQQLFAGHARELAVTWCNSSDQAAPAVIHAQIWQASPATAVKMSGVRWKTLGMLPRQTVLESTTLDFPMVTAKTKFLVQWCENSNHVIGTTEVLVYPTNLLAELKLLLPGENQIPGLLDPRHEIKTALAGAGVKFIDLEEMNLDDFSGPLAVIGPCQPDDPEWSGLTARISRMAQRGTSVVWIQSSRKGSAEIHPSYYIVPKTKAVIVVVDPVLVADLSSQPQSQLNLIYFCKLALRPEPFQLPELTDQTNL